MLVSEPMLPWGEVMFPCERSQFLPISAHSSVIFFYFLKILFFFILERGKEGERERKKNINQLPFEPKPGTEPKTQACALTRNRTGNLLLCRTTPNQLSHTGMGQFSHLGNTNICFISIEALYSSLLYIFLHIGVLTILLLNKMCFIR